MTICLTDIGVQKTFGFRYIVGLPKGGPRGGEKAWNL